MLRIHNLLETPIIQTLLKDEVSVYEIRRLICWVSFQFMSVRVSWVCQRKLIANTFYWRTPNIIPSNNSIEWITLFWGVTSALACHSGISHTSIDRHHNCVAFSVLMLHDLLKCLRVSVKTLPCRRIIMTKFRLPTMVLILYCIIDSNLVKFVQLDFQNKITTMLIQFSRGGPPESCKRTSTK